MWTAIYNLQWDYEMDYELRELQTTFLELFNTTKLLINEINALRVLQILIPLNNPER